MSKKIKITITVLSFFFVFLGVFFINSKNVLTKQEIKIIKSVSENSEIKTILEINGEKYETEIKNRISVYDFMNKLRSEGKIKFTEKNYIGMGKFIETINDIKNNGEKNWIYYVNGKKAQVGVSNYKIKTGDIVSWKYERNN